MSIKADIKKKQRYDAQANSIKTLSTLDNWDKDQFFYGRKNGKGRVIVPFDISTMTQLNETKICFNFVADAFNDFNNHYREKVLSGLEPYAGLPILKAEKAFVKPLSLYYEHQKRLEAIFLDKYLLAEQASIDTFDDFLYQFDRFVKDYAHRYPILYSSYANSSLCPMHGTGLLIEFKGARHNDDEERLRLINDPSFGFVSDLAKEYGFVIPKHAPWSLFANLDSQIMINYAIQYNALDKEQVLEEYFYECKDHDIDLMKSFIFNSYEAFFENSPRKSETRICKNGRLKTVTEFRQKEEPITLSKRYPSRFWFRMYIETLLREQNKEMSKTKLDKLFSECYYILEKYSFERAYTFVEMKILQTRKDRIR